MILGGLGGLPQGRNVETFSRHELLSTRIRCIIRPNWGHDASISAFLADSLSEIPKHPIVSPDRSGPTGLNASRLSFGASSLGSVFRPVDEADVICTVHAALDPLIRQSKETAMSNDETSAALVATDVLAAGLGADAVLQRDKLPALDSTNCEIVTCRMPNGSLRQLFCKFGPLAEVEQPPHCFGVAYETQVYDQLLPVWQNDVPRLHGALLDETTQMVGLALDYLEDATSLNQVPQPKAGLLAAARWIASFHHWSETVAVPSFLHRYDTEFYRVWMQRAGHFTLRLHERYPWLPELCERCQRRLPALLPPATIIHGEYRANNILDVQSHNVSIDWESAVLAAGEIDLASLTRDWDDDIASLCEQEYCLARWPEGTPDDFALRLAAAHVFLHLRQLGDSEEEDGAEERIAEVEELLPLAERLRDLDL